jgi:hypothetical protein
MKPIDLMLDNDNELRFKVSIEGTRPGTSVCRLMLEGPEMSYSFKGQQTPDNEVVVNIPSMKGIIKEGVYDVHLEVVVDDRIFIPLEMKTNFEKSVSVTAEAVNYTQRKKPSAKAVLVETNSQPRNLKQIKQSRNNPTIQNKNKKIDRLNDKKIIEIINILKSKQREQ